MKTLKFSKNQTEILSNYCTSRITAECFSRNQTSDIGFLFFYRLILVNHQQTIRGQQVDFNYTLKSSSWIRYVIWLVIQSLSFPTILLTQPLSLWSSCPHPSRTTQTYILFCNRLHGMTLQSISSLCVWLISTTYNYRVHLPFLCSRLIPNPLSV